MKQPNTKWLGLRILAHVCGQINQDLELRCEYLEKVVEIQKAHIPGRLRLTDDERRALGEIGHRLGKKRLEEIDSPIAQPDTILGWFRKLVAAKFDGSKNRRSPGRPKIDQEVEKLILKFAEAAWGSRKIVGALANLGYKISHQTVLNALKRHQRPPAPERAKKIAWPEFLKIEMAVTAACDFFTVEVLTLRGLVTYYVLFFIHLETRRVDVAGLTRHPDQSWMEQIARNVTMEGVGFLNGYKALLHDRDTKFCPAFLELLKKNGIEAVALPPRSPNLNCIAERWVRTVKSEALSKVILLGESSLRRVLSEFVIHYHEERNHQGKGNVLLFPAAGQRIGSLEGTIRCKERLGGLLKYYYRKAA
jgi:transposase InsO family protein